MDERLPLSAEVRAALPAPVQEYPAYQDTQIALLHEQVDALEGELVKLCLHLAETRARAKQHSGNSSRPPSSDPPSAPPRAKHEPSGRKRGGEIGAWGQAAVHAVTNVFAARHRFKEGDGDRATLQQEIASLRTQLQALWERGTTLPALGIRAFCNDVRALEPARWTFMTVEGASRPTTPPSGRCGRPSCGARAASGRTVPPVPHSWRQS